MLQKLKNLIKRIPGINYAMGTLIQRNSGKQNATFFSFRANFLNNSNWDITKIDKNRDIYFDRLFEIKTFYHISIPQLIIHYLRNGTPNTNYYKYRMLTYFDTIGKDKDTLKKSYDASDFMYAQRLMLRYHNYNIGKKANDIFRRLGNSSLKDVKVLDYGCGIADPSLLLALYGANVTIVDLDTKKFKFAQARFKQRNLKVYSISAKQTEIPCDIPEDLEFDLIIMAEFLEHVRNPRLFLEFAISRLKDGGIIYDSLGSEHKHGIGGDHLEEAKYEIETTDYKEYFLENLQPINVILNENSFEHFYIKQVTCPTRRCT
jgi:2-polyprenyl-3-methyl-5-hydroxy-6-metoxy-1,4-benzoquinol methylase